jgi:hypothetical protein
MTKHLEENQWLEEANSFTLAAACNEAFRAMFKLDPAVIARAQEFKDSAGITGPYAGLHMRKGDSNMGVTGISEAQLRGLKSRETDNVKTLNCYHEVKALHSDAFSVAYLASDDSGTKQEMAKADPSIHFAHDMKPFHVDLLARKGNAKFDAFDPAVTQGVIDTWAEMLVLSESTCLLLSQSMFSFASLYMRGPRDCVIHLNSCHVPSHREGHNSYYAEQIYGRGWVIIRNATSPIVRRLSEEIIPGPILNEQIIPDESSQEQHQLTPEEMQEKHIKQYLGGLYPKVDRQFHPLYLRDTLHPRTIDPKWGEVVDGDIPFFW